jgi:hypothetical protein
MHLYHRKLNTALSETLGPSLLHDGGKWGNKSISYKEGSKTILIYMRGVKADSKVLEKNLLLLHF